MIIPKIEEALRSSSRPGDIEISVETGESNPDPNQNHQQDEPVDMRDDSVFQFGGGDEIAAICISAKQDERSNRKLPKKSPYAR